MALYRWLGRRWTALGLARPYCQSVNAGIDETPEEEDLIEQKRNKSRLRAHHYNSIHHQLPENLSEDEEFAMSLRAQRKRYGEFGAASGINLAKLWPSKEELELEKEWEKVARPHSVQEMISIAKKAKEDEERAIQKRQEELMQKVAKLEGWKKEVRDRIMKQELEAQIAKEKKEKLIEEVRQILGFQIDPKDERFKEALLQKEKEEKKAKKEAKKLARQKRMIERLRQETYPSSTPVKDASGQSETGEGSSISPGSPIV